MNNAETPPVQQPLQKLGFNTSDALLHGRNLRDNSRNVEAGDVFVCLPRAASQARAYCQKAIEAGAVALVGTKDALVDTTSFSVPSLVFENVNELAAWLRQWHQSSQSKVQCIGITGTDGKTSVTWMLREALQRFAGQSNTPGAWSVGTLGLIRSTDECEELANTTPSLLTNHDILAAAMQSHVSTVVWEVSSHGIAQQRIAGIPFSLALWTTLGHDHIEDHGSFEQYAASKALFMQKTMLGGGLLIANGDQPQLMDYLRDMPEVHCYQQWPADTGAMKEDTLYWQQQGNEALLLQRGSNKVLIQHVPRGQFHAQNLAAVATVLHLHWKMPLAELPQLLNHMTAPPGRMQAVSEHVYVDFAHTPEALQGCLQQARAWTQGQLKLVFGCGGNRDKAKRPQMGAAAANWADEIWLTSDNPRDEAAETIMHDIYAGMTMGSSVCHMQADRKQAIYAAIASLQDQDVLVIAGKGHENYMETAGKRVPWSDAAIAREAVLKYAGAALCN
ncbi:MAG: UDP-N-acetylmuramoylalanyl-D-glutamate--2,6-diaminopimelate ligase [Zetaproteobacteria bacterium CG_4_9_14_3_um_filter_49_83]|nr:MAG: hypothetical protein AUJ56_10440 [Zetaproteobacteria bacterium CG1_02_49_23]PIQ34440.1 MAG: UDP-N-acetylmuramoylalanyl-D-glutamate--2,6-diaminopimelate ligase [Zetaproteobacteria bacterium CG17_big_fil_post_rev_8_21_14_2_50_50_13]PIV29049.1 MAG: UDP-N-acetylmuramoylalanyl-D-glutamate--2,6-diaminopimelate ligase [Zetaproteobacteria bacterium CG02_land_8_20_14_3_00_50_9]PIY56423.1 MAG: UDP-N-acetylmuramoylalanyl-D-glutamate--2,6-diaminopimelate ligase [Zetaproteobacteria bacterium CG_4_10_